MDQAHAFNGVSETQVPDGPKHGPGFFGTAAQLRFFLDPFRMVTGRFARYGDVYRVRQRDGDLFVFRHPDHIKDILVTQAAAFDKSHAAFKRLSLVLGDALLTSDGERWRRQRRLVQPAFARSRLAEYGAVMVDEAARAASRLSQRGACDVSREMNALTLGIVTRTLFGQLADEAAVTGRAMLDLNRWFTTPPQIARLIPGRTQGFERVIAELDAVIDRLIATRRAAGGAGTDLLSALMVARDEDGEALAPRELRDQLLTLYLAGHETTSHALTWTLYLLAAHPRVREQLDAEHTRVFGGRLPSFDDLAALPYTEQVIKEALRMYPPAFVLPRHVHEDVRIGPYLLPKGSEIVIWTYFTHHDPRWFPQPEQFKPERFEAASEAARPKYAYLPFGAGQRACIGQAFAMIEAQLVLATLLPRLRFEYAGRRAPRLGLGLTLAPKRGLPMRVSAR